MAKKAAIKKVKAKKTVSKTNSKATVKTAKKTVTVDSLLKVGQKAPSFSLTNELGEKISLKSLTGKKVVLYFYPKDDTPGCTQESCDFRDNFARLKKSGAVVLGVSKDSETSHQKFKTKYSLPFSLLSDEEGKVCEAYGVWREKNLYGKKYMGIVRSTFLIDEAGKISKIYPKVSVAGHVDEVMKDLK